MAAPVISIIIPTFRRPEYLASAVQSVLTNGFGNFELIISDDYADGQVEAYLKKLNDPRIRYTAHRSAEDVQKKGAQSYIFNWQYAAKLTRGEFVFKLDDDDLILPGFLQRCVEFLKSHPQASSVYTAHECFSQQDQPGISIFDTGFFPANRYCAEGAAYVRAVLTNRGGYPRNHKTMACYRRQVGEKLGFYQYAREDFAFSAALGLQGRVGYIPECLYRWRSHPENAAKNYVSIWRSAQAALESLRQLPWTDDKVLLVSDWKQCLRECEEKLPLYYFIAALRDGSGTEAMHLRQILDQEVFMKQKIKWMMSGLWGIHQLGGKRAIRLLFEFYVKYVGKLTSNS